MLKRWNTSGAPSAPWARDGFADPFGDLGIFAELRREMDRMFDGLDPRIGTPALGAGFGAPRFELEDEGEKLVVRADLPGFREEDVDVQIERSTLTIRGRRVIETPEGHVAHRRERGAMEIARAFTLPTRIDPERASATLQNGVLELTLPKVPDAQPRKIEVRAS